jgi:hypothetical protein
MKAVCRRTGLEQQQHAHAAAVPPHIAYLSQPVQQQTAFTSRVQDGRMWQKFIDQIQTHWNNSKIKIFKNLKISNKLSFYQKTSFLVKFREMQLFLCKMANQTFSVQLRFCLWSLQCISAEKGLNSLTRLRSTIFGNF